MHMRCAAKTTKRQRTARAFNKVRLLGLYLTAAGREHVRYAAGNLDETRADIVSCELCVHTHSSTQQY